MHDLHRTRNGFRVLRLLVQGLGDAGARVGVGFADGLLHLEVEAGALARSGDAERLVASGVDVVLDVQDQAVAGGEGEVVVDEGVTRDVDLGGQGAVARLDDVEVDVGRTVAGIS